ncbi:HAD-IA family hydrolase [Streptomyces sp. NPDC005963]|uniref:HAD family hydrolase n=1 Tax=Streptomyces sp. NPDC005963 TaxID=3156721 RepID=UPI0033E1F92F
MTGSPPAAIAALFSAAGCVLFDFDGPVCHLFGRHPAASVAAGLRRWTERRIPGGVAVEPGAEDDPLALLRAVADAHPGDPLVQELERRLTAEEVRAARTAEPTRGAEALIRGLHQAGYRLAVTTNNSPDAAHHYLARVGLSASFAGHVHGRAPEEPKLMKPDPHCLRRALDTTGSTPDEAVMIGDSVADGEAAARLGVPFLGYARGGAKEARLWEAGAVHVVTSMVDLLPVLDGPHRHPPRDLRHDLPRDLPREDRPSGYKLL